MNFAAAAANSMTGISRRGKTIINSSTVANGFFIVWPTSVAVTTAVHSTISAPSSRLMPQPMLTPLKITGKKCPPLSPVSMHRFVSSSLTTPITSSRIAPTLSGSSITSLIWCSPENIVSGSSVPTAPSRNPPTVARRTTCFRIFAPSAEVSFLKRKYR